MNGEIFLEQLELESKFNIPNFNSRLLNKLIYRNHDCNLEEFKNILGNIDKMKMTEYKLKLTRERIARIDITYIEKLKEYLIPAHELKLYDFRDKIID